MATYELKGTTQQFDIPHQNLILALKVDPAGTPVFTKLAETVADVNGNFTLQWEDWDGRVVLGIVDDDGAVQVNCKFSDWKSGVVSTQPIFWNSTTWYNLPAGAQIYDAQRNGVSSNVVIGTPLIPRDSGKLYIEIKAIDAAGENGNDIAVIGAPTVFNSDLRSGSSGGNCNVMRLWTAVLSLSSAARSPQGTSLGIPANNTGDIIMIAVDTHDNGDEPGNHVASVWYGLNGTWALGSDPTVPGTHHDAPLNFNEFGVGMRLEPNRHWKFLGGDEPLVYTPPSGYKPWGVPV